jgi:hypothetical protein
VSLAAPIPFYFGGGSQQQLNAVHTNAKKRIPMMRGWSTGL